MARSYFFLLIAFTVGIQTNAAITLPALFSDGMVMQRNVPLKIWGWASAGEHIKVGFKQQTYRTKADSSGYWKVLLPSQKPGGPFEMTIKSGRDDIAISDILIGDVWLCSGQSNMEHQMKLHENFYAKEIEEAAYQAIRQFKIPNVTNLVMPQRNFTGGSWTSANRKDVLEFSAVAYFFALHLYQKYKVPIGIINASWGGTPIEAWMSEESLNPFPSLLKKVQENKTTPVSNAVHSKNLQATDYYPQNDLGLIEKWYEPAYSSKGWRRIAVPGYWEDQGLPELDGVVWYRREIEIPESIANEPARLFLGRIVDADKVYINGKLIGTTSYLYPQRRYAVPKGVLKRGTNIVAVQVTNHGGKGGFVPDKPYQLLTATDTITLTGYWQYKVAQAKIGRSNSISNPAAPILHYQPTALYNAMLAPIMGYGIKGFVWYQGESNVGRHDEYRALQSAMITDWRKKWGWGDLPFLFVQLPGFGDYRYSFKESAWASFREAQASSLSLPLTGMAVAIDLGEWNDVHPDRKKEVGDRLALLAQKIAFKENIIASGPKFESFLIDGQKINLSFSNTGGGLVVAENENLSDFYIAGQDRVFYPANATIEKNQVRVSSPQVPEPKHVRYAWADMPVNPNLCNKERLPAAPFRTDGRNP